MMSSTVFLLILRWWLIFSVGLTGIDEFQDAWVMAVGFDALTRVQAKHDVPLARRGDARAHAFTQQIPLELGV